MLNDTNWGKRLQVELEPWRKTLTDAADYIEDHGWVQCSFEKDGSVCPIRAITIVGAGSGAINTALVRLRNHIKESTIIGWNDDPCRTKEECITAMRAAALSYSCQ